MMRSLITSFTILIIVFGVTPVFIYSHILLNYYPPRITPFYDGVVESFMNSILFLILTILFGFIMIMLIRNPKAFNLFIILAVTYIAFTITYYYSSIYISYLINTTHIFPTLISILITSIFLISMIKNYNFIYNVFLLLIMVALGVFFHFSIDITTEIIVLVLYSVFDYVSVTRGFLKKLFETRSQALNSINLLLIRLGNIGIGTGDIIFYSMLLSVGYSMLNVLGYLTGIIGISLGHTINISLIKKYKMIPALPIPILITLFLYIILYYMQF